MPHAADSGSSNDVPRAAVLGGGAWGTVLATLLARTGHSVSLWTRRVEHAHEIERARANPAYLPDLVLPEQVRATADLSVALAGAEMALLAVPVSGFRPLLRRLAELEIRDTPLFSCSKGIEVGSFKRLSQIIAEELPGALVGVLSGPNLASEIASGQPAATTVASAEPGLAQLLQGRLQQPRFRVYTSADVVGVEIGGALKNVIALAAGMSDGLGLGDNAKAGIITRGLAEMVRFGESQGGEARTLYGLSGLGDLVATCGSEKSRNHTAGKRIAAGATAAQLARENLTAEGIPTAKALHQYSREASVVLPICDEVYRVIYQGKPPSAALDDLMTRERRAE